jgi:hypothetical protein
MTRLVLTIATFFSLLRKKRRGDVSVSWALCASRGAALSDEENTNMFLVSQTRDQSDVDLSPHPPFTSLLPPFHKLSKHESAPAYKQCEIFSHNHTKKEEGKGGIDLNSISVYRLPAVPHRLTSQPTWEK